LFARSAGNIIFSIIIAVAGIVSAVFLAEYIGKKYGLNNFFGRVSATPDIDGAIFLIILIRKKVSKTDIGKTTLPA
jgi:hypothetical protein